MSPRGEVSCCQPAPFQCASTIASDWPALSVATPATQTLSGATAVTTPGKIDVSPSGRRKAGGGTAGQDLPFQRTTTGRGAVPGG
jgi:hypothetical protein